MTADPSHGMIYATYDFYLLIKYRYRIDIAIFWQYRIDIVSNSKNQYGASLVEAYLVIYVCAVLYGLCLHFGLNFRGIVRKSNY